MVDPRLALEDAVRERRACRIGRVGGDLRRGALCRLEGGGVVCVVPGHDLRSGEEVRLWFEEGGSALHFEATIARAGVPVPDRSGDGLLLGFLSPLPIAAASARDPEPVAPAGAGAVLDVLLASGAPMSLLDAPVEIVHFSVDKLEFQVPRGSTLLFPEQGVLHLLLGSDTARCEARARVSGVVVSESHRLYQLEIEAIGSQTAYGRALTAIAARAGL